MGNDDGENWLLARLPTGEHIVSTLLTDHTPPRHIYRILNPSGRPLQEFSTLNELNHFVSRYADLVAPVSSRDE